MKKLINLLFLSTILFMSCNKNNKTESITSPIDPLIPRVNFKITDTTKVPIRVDETGITLPVGTIVQLSEDDTQIKVLLPTGHSFTTRQQLTDNSNSKLLPVEFTIGSYTCMCSASDKSNCKVFYQPNAGGFGCIHNTCSGACTGAFSSGGSEIMGTFNTRMADITYGQVNTEASKASLAKGGLDLFFSNSTVKNKIKNLYANIYMKEPLPDFEHIDDKKYFLLSANLYGVNFFVVVPKQLSAKLSSDFETAPIGASCSCSNISGGDCNKKGGSVLGLKAYWCEGTCNGCTLTITK